MPPGPKKDDGGGKGCGMICMHAGLAWLRIRPFAANCSALRRRNPTQSRAHAAGNRAARKQQLSESARAWSWSLGSSVRSNKITLLRRKPEPYLKADSTPPLRNRQEGKVPPHLGQRGITQRETKSVKRHGKESHSTSSGGGGGGTLPAAVHPSNNNRLEQPAPIEA